MKQEKCRKSEVQLPKLSKNPKLYYCFSYRDRRSRGDRYCFKNQTFVMKSEVF